MKLINSFKEGFIMKKKISLLLAIVMLVTLLPTAFAESKTVEATKNTKKVTLDGEEVKVGSYVVEGYNYLKLRDVAAILNAKKCQFDVGYDKEKKLITVALAKAYEKVEGDLAEIKEAKAQAKVEEKKLLVDGEEKEVKTALINGYNYMQLRDLGSLVGLDVKYDAKNKVIMLNSDAQAKEEAPRYVMIKSKLYKDTGEINKNMKCGTMDGKILTSVDAKEMPKKDNESNFGTGYEYQIGTGSITVEINNECYIFKEVKEEKKEEEKKEEKKYTEEENNIFNGLILMNDLRVEKFKDFAQIPITGDEGDDLYANIVNMSILHGRRLFIDGARVEKSITMEEGKKCYNVTFTYPSGGSYTIKAATEEGKDQMTMTESFTYSPIIGLIDENKDIRKLSEEELKEKFTKVHDAFGANDYKKAAEILRELNYDASEDKVKELVEQKRADAKRFGREIFSKDYKVTVSSQDVSGANYMLIAFRYNNGMAFRFDIYPEYIKGLGTMYLYTDRY